MLKKTIRGLIIGIILGLLLSLFNYWGFFHNWHLRLTSFLYVGHEVSPDIVIVAIDDKSFNDPDLGRWQEWRRTYYAQAINNLNKDGAKVIGIDVSFPEKTKGVTREQLETESKENIIGYLDPAGVHPDDQELADTIKESNDIILVLGAKQFADQIVDDRFLVVEEALFPTPTIKEAIGDNYGWANNYLNIQDNVAREIPLGMYYQNKYYEAFALKLARKYLGLKDNPEKGDIIDNYYTFNNESIISQEINWPPTYIPAEGASSMLISYAGPPLTYPMISFNKVYHGDFQPDTFRDKIVLIGSTATDLHDEFITPVSAGKPMPGVEIHANALQTILEQRFLQTQPLSSQTLWIILLTIISSLVFVNLKIIWSAIIAILEIAIYTVTTWLSFDMGTIMNMIYPFLAIILAYVAILLYRYITEEREKKQIKGAFSRYVTASVVSEILKKPGMLKLGGQRREMTVHFSDVAGFTTISEQLTPENLVQLLNDYLGEMTDIIFKHQGTLDKYEGDAIMAFWNAPLDDPNHAINACYTSLECQERLAVLREKWLAEGKPEVRARIGLNSGPMIVGNMGSTERFDYTVMGDAVNLGARLEGANKQYGTYIMISENTYALAKDAIEVRELDCIRVKGKKQPITVYELLSKKGELSATKQKIVSEYLKGLEAYKKQKWDEAIKYFEAALKIDEKDGPSAVYIERCKEYKKNPPGKDWDGAYTMTTK